VVTSPFDFDASAGFDFGAAAGSPPPAPPAVLLSSLPLPSPQRAASPSPLASLKEESAQIAGGAGQQPDGEEGEGGGEGAGAFGAAPLSPAMAAPPAASPAGNAFFTLSPSSPPATGNGGGDAPPATGNGGGDAPPATGNGGGDAPPATGNGGGDSVEEGGTAPFFCGICGSDLSPDAIAAHAEVCLASHQPRRRSLFGSGAILSASASIRRASGSGSPPAPGTPSALLARMASGLRRLSASASGAGAAFPHFTEVSAAEEWAGTKGGDPSHDAFDFSVGASDEPPQEGAPLSSRDLATPLRR
jgi:hypothetical protein